MLEISNVSVARKLKHGATLPIIDVREDKDVSDGVIPGACHIPFKQLSRYLHKLNRDESYIVTCHSGGRSELATEYLIEQGYKARKMSGGMVEWTGPIERI